MHPVRNYEHAMQDLLHAIGRATSNQIGYDAMRAFVVYF